MKPNCKLCGTRHWTYEDHYTATSAGRVPEYVREMVVGAMGYEKRIPVFPDLNPPESVTTATEGPLVYVPANKRTEPLTGRNKRTRGRPRKWASEAERKRAYRRRK